MLLIRPRLAATVTGLPRNTLSDYWTRWPFMAWRSGPGARDDMFIPPAALPFVVVARQAYAARLSRAEIDGLLLAMNYPAALISNRYPRTLLYSPQTGDLRVNGGTLAELRERDAEAAVVIAGDDHRPATILFDVAGIVATCTARLDAAEPEGEDRVELRQQWAILATDAMLRAHERFAAEVEAGEQ